MQWQATDQFGNLYIGVSDSMTVDDLSTELASMIDELASRNPGPITLTVDQEYGEINGPDPNQVSHVLRAEWLTKGDYFEAISVIVIRICAEKGLSIRIERA